MLECNLVLEDDYPIFMAVCEKCGHDRRGNILEEDLSLVAPAFKKWKTENDVNF